MQENSILEKKRILVVDDEPDILESLKLILDMCVIDTATGFEEARDLLENNFYDAAILDIMGVDGYDILAITTRLGIPSLMLTAHALSPENLVKAIKGGAGAYVPKEKISDIETFLEDILLPREKGAGRLGRWFARLEPFFERKFGAYWKEKSDPEFWSKYY